MNRFPIVFQLPPREGDGGAGGGSSPGPGGEGAAPAPSPQPAAAWTMPDGYPDRLRADTAEQFYARLSEDWKVQHAKLSGLPPPPKSVDDYRFDPSEKAKPFVGDLSKDPVFATVRQAALAAGIPGEAFSKLVGGFYDGMADAGLLAKPMDVAAEAGKFLGKTGLSEQQALTELAPIAEPMFRTIDKLAADAKLPNEGKAALYSLMDTADGMRAMAAIVGALKTTGLQPGGERGGQGAPSREELRDMQKDPRADRNSRSYDPEFVARMQEAYNRKFGS